jgi:hypothetical protein
MHPAAAAFVCVLSARNFTNAAAVSLSVLHFYLCKVSKQEFILLRAFLSSGFRINMNYSRLLRTVSYFKCIFRIRDFLPSAVGK